MLQDLIFRPAGVFLLPILYHCLGLHPNFIICFPFKIVIIVVSSLRVIGIKLIHVPFEPVSDLVHKLIHATLFFEGL